MPANEDGKLPAAAVPRCNCDVRDVGHVRPAKAEHARLSDRRLTNQKDPESRRLPVVEAASRRAGSARESLFCGTHRRSGHRQAELVRAGSGAHGLGSERCDSGNAHALYGN